LDRELAVVALGELPLDDLGVRRQIQRHFLRLFALLLLGDGDLVAVNLLDGGEELVRHGETDDADDHERSTDKPQHACSAYRAPNSTVGHTPTGCRDIASSWKTGRGRRGPRSGRTGEYVDAHADTIKMKHSLL